MKKAAERLRWIWSHPANRHRRWRALARAVAWQASKRLWARPWDLELYDGCRVRCHLDDDAAVLALYTGGWHDWHEMGFLRDYLRPGDHFLDVGANIGLYALLAARLVGPTGRVEALEPDPLVGRRLQDNLARNPGAPVQVHAVAAGSAEGTARFVTQRGTSNHLARSDDDPGNVIEVRTVTLDAEFSHCQFAAAKMDIEGAEPLALAGAERMLASHNPPVWLLELNGQLRSYGFTEQGLAKRCTASNPCDDPPDYECTGYVNANGQCMVWNPQGWYFTYNGCAPRRSYCNAYGSCWCY